jgi:hypothetical protein
VHSPRFGDSGSRKPTKRGPFYHFPFCGLATFFETDVLQNWNLFPDKFVCAYVYIYIYIYIYMCIYIYIYIYTRTEENCSNLQLMLRINKHQAAVLSYHSLFLSLFESNGKVDIILYVTTVNGDTRDNPER